MRRDFRRASLAVAALVFGAALLGAGRWLLTPEPPARAAGATAALPALAQLLDCARPGYARAAPGWTPVLPSDHGAHPAFCGEAWRVSAVLRDGGRRLAVQLVLLRATLTPPPEAAAADGSPPPAPGVAVSGWASDQLYRGYWSMSELGGGDRWFGQRISRAAIGLAGAGGEPLQVWLESWRLTFEDDAVVLDLRQPDGRRLMLTLTPRTSPVSTAAGPLLGYTLARLDAAGRRREPGRDWRAVAGSAWFEHGWGALPAAGGQLSVARLLLQLDDGRELQLVARRRRSGGGTPIVEGTLLTPERRWRLRRRDLTLEEREHWRGPHGGRYPVRWRLRIPAHAIDVELVAARNDQWLDLSPPVWSGAADIVPPAGADNAGLGGVAWIDLSGYTAPDRT